MESVRFLNNQEITTSTFLPKEVKVKKKRGGYKNFSSNSEYRKWYYETHPEKKEILLAKKRAKYKKKVGGKLKYNKSILEHLKEHRYINWFKFFNAFFEQGHKKDGSDVKKCSCAKHLNKTIGEIGYKKFLKIIHTWHLPRRQKREYLKAIEYNQVGVCLGIKPSWSNYRIGCIDIDKSKGYSTLFKSQYVSNRIGSIHFYFLYKENDLGKENLIIGERKNKNGKIKKPNLILGDLKADFKMCQYMMAPLSLHHTGNLYRIRGQGSFFIGRFEKASEVLKIFAEKANQKQTKKWIKQRRPFGQEPLIKVVEKKYQHLFQNFECQILYVDKQYPKQYEYRK